MVLYDFDEQIERGETASLKWDGLQERWGSADVLPMWVADMDFKSPAPVIKAIQKRAAHGVYGYTLRENYFPSLISWFSRRHGWPVQSNWLVNVPGVVPALGTIIESFTSPGDAVIIQQPVYYPFANLILHNGRRLLNNSLRLEGGRYVMDFNDLEQKAQAGAKLLILCNPHNPVGRVWTREELIKLGQICLNHGILVVSDEIHCDLVLPGHSHVPFASICPEFSSNSVSCVSASKTFNLAGLQTATVIVPNEELRARYQATLKRFALGAANVFGIVATEAAYRDGEEWLAQLSEYLQRNLVRLTEFINENIPQLDVIQPEGTYLVWIDCRRLGFSNAELEAFFLTRAKLALDMGHAFGGDGEGFVRINIACRESLLDEALNRLHKAVQDLVHS